MERIDNNALREVLRHAFNAPGIAPDDARELLDSFDALVIDASRYRGLRLIVTEPNHDVRERMIDAVEKALPDDPDDSPTAARVDELCDLILMAASGARNAG